MLVKVQARFRGLIGRNYARAVAEEKYFQESAGYQGQDNYDNPGVQNMRQQLGDFEYDDYHFE